jgi:hypothetical protein
LIVPQEPVAVAKVIVARLLVVPLVPVDADVFPWVLAQLVSALAPTLTRAYELALVTSVPAVESVGHVVYSATYHVLGVPDACPRNR